MTLVCKADISVIKHAFYLSYYLNIIYFLSFQDKTTMSKNRDLMYINPIVLMLTNLVNVMEIGDFWCDV